MAGADRHQLNIACPVEVHTMLRRLAADVGIPLGTLCVRILSAAVLEAYTPADGAAREPASG